MRISHFCFAAALLLVGCSQPENKATVDRPVTTVPNKVVTNKEPDPVVPPAPTPENPAPTDVTPTEPKIKPNKPTINVQVPAPKTGGWHATKMTVAQLAAKIGGATKGLRNTKAETLMLARTAEGEGEYKGEIVVKDPKTYKVDYVVIDNRPLSATDIADGKYRMIRLDDKWSGALLAGKPLGVANRTGTELAAQWPIDFSRMVFQGLTDGKDAWGPVIGAWGKNGFGVIVEERQMAYKGRQITNYRVRAQRTAAAAKKLGAATTEIVVDGTRFLPVTIRVDRTDVQGKKWMCQWSARWKFNQTTQPVDFKMPLPQ